jgi:hypothetical protein
MPLSSPPPVSSYHPAIVDMTRCIGRRTSEKLQDRRWSYTVYRAVQCTAARPADGDGLCAECRARQTDRPHPATSEGSYGCWQGVVTDMASLPPASHIAGSAWFLSGKPKWLGVDRPKAVHVRRSAAVAVAVPTAEEQLAATREELRAARQEIERLRASLASIAAIAAPAPAPALEALD